jgi:hypothetical protein
MIILNLGIQDIGDGFCYTHRCGVGKSLIDSCKKPTGEAIPSLMGAPVVPCYVIALPGQYGTPFAQTTTGGPYGTRDRRKLPSESKSLGTSGKA